MRIMKRIFYLLLAICALPFLAALFMGKEWSVDREITINKPVSEIFPYVSNLEKQSNWSTFVLQDPKIKMTYTGEQGKIGSVAAYQSEVVGNGHQKITKITENERVDIELTFLRPSPSVAQCYIGTEAVTDTQTKVRWAIVGRSNYPMNALTPFINKIIGGEYERSLMNLKKQLEK
jgi:uncharacterized membrane protein